jgi:hypothetical protein
MAEPKHFAFNHQEMNRSGLSTFLTEQAARENELRSFQKCLSDNNAQGLMTAFNRAGTSYAGAYRNLLVNILRNEVQDVMAGGQLGIYNSAGRADCLGVQLGLFNEARSIRGVQLGIINLADNLYGIQVGLINRAETAYGFQVGGVNVIRESDLAFCPIVNIGFDKLTPML